MLNISEIIRRIRSGGYRITKAREAIITIFAKAKAPLSAGEIEKTLKGMGVHINKTTVYREVDFLKAEGVLKELSLGDNIRRYEFRTDNHHHHIICIKCNKVECIDMPECVEKEEKIVSKRSRFKIIDHSLKFYGVCPGCM